jgi:hypothetical protein
MNVSWLLLSVADLLYKLTSIVFTIVILLGIILIGWLLLWHLILKHINFFREMIGLNNNKITKRKIK